MKKKLIKLTVIFFIFIGSFSNVGSAEDKIKIDRMCTYETENLHSYRRDKEKSGRMLSFIALKQ